MASTSLATTPEPRTFTWDDFLALPDDDRRELLDGRFVEMEMPNILHEFIVAWLCARLWSWAESNEAGIVLASGLKVKVTDRRGAMPDVQFVRRDNPGLGPQGFAGGRPDLAVEVISPGSARYDRVTKLQWYASIGIPEYWIIDPENKSVERLVRDEGVLQVVEQVLHDGVFKPASFPGLELPLAKMWTMGGFAAP